MSGKMDYSKGSAKDLMRKHGFETKTGQQELAGLARMVSSSKASLRAACESAMHSGIKVTKLPSRRRG